MEDNKGSAEMVDRKLKVGDKVKVIEYGHFMFKHKKGYQEESDYFAKAQAEFNNSMSKALFGEYGIFEDVELAKGKSEPDNIYKDCGDMWWIDMRPELVGQEGVVSEVTTSQERLRYAVDGIKGKCAWYNENQLELIKTDSVDRKEGYYWVKFNADSEWTGAKWNGKDGMFKWWSMVGSEWTYEDKELFEIDERQICRS